MNMRKIWETSISKRLAVSFLIIVFASFLIAGGVGFYLFNNMVQTTIQHDVEHDLDAANVIFQTQLTDTAKVVEYSSCNSRIRDPLINNDHAALRQGLFSLYNEHFNDTIDILTVTDNHGIVVARARNPAMFGDSMENNPLIGHALMGEMVSSVEIISREGLLKESEFLADQAFMEFTNTPKAKPRSNNYSTSGMVMMAATPIYDDDGNLAGVLYGADLINRDYRIVDLIKDALYSHEVYDGLDVGTVTIFQDDFRISTNVLTYEGKRAITTRVSQEVNEAVLERGEPWNDRAFVVNSWYVTAYEPIRNLDGDIIGILYVGILEQPYIDAGYKILLVYVGFLLLGFLISMLISRYFTRSIISPINNLIEGTEAIAKGKFKGLTVSTNDEIGKLSTAFNDMAVELQKTIAELILSKNEVETVFESISDVASALDKDMKITYANRLAKDQYGEDIIGKICFQVFEERSDVCDDCPAIISMDTGSITRTVHIRSNESGVSSYLEITGSPLRDEQDNIKGTVMIRRDVTEQKILENELRKSYMNLEIAYKELKQVDTMKAELVANISHEIRTPLTSIRGYAELLLDGTLGQTTDQQLKSMKVVIRNVDRLTRMISNVLDLSRFDQQERVVREVRLKEIIKHAVDDLENEITDKSIGVTVEVSDYLILECDPDALEQVFINLMGNAIKFTNKGGSATIKAYFEDKHHIHIEVIDTGVGIPEDQFELVFDRFYQIDASSTRKYGGTGLGLAITKKIVEWHIGTIWVRNKPDGCTGSVFHIILPVKHRDEIYSYK
ncbi:MAG: cache domain-containing protein [ANME-2 cluster archaeon]|nr:cache domain-containing protein [ANME-2 cluster archaeon]